MGEKVELDALGFEQFIVFEECEAHLLGLAECLLNDKCFVAFAALERIGQTPGWIDSDRPGGVGRDPLRPLDSTAGHRGDRGLSAGALGSADPPASPPFVAVVDSRCIPHPDPVVDRRFHRHRPGPGATGPITRPHGPIDPAGPAVAAGYAEPGEDRPRAVQA